MENMPGIFVKNLSGWAGIGRHEGGGGGGGGGGSAFLFLFFLLK